jgi:Uma2 family endonuclease
MDWLPRGAELIDGEIVVEDSPRIRQHLAIAELFARLQSWIDAGSARGVCGNPGAVDFAERVEVPSLWWYSERRRPGDEDVHLRELPDLAVYVPVVPSDEYEPAPQLARYADAGLPEMWVVDPQSRDGVNVRVFRRSRPEVSTFDLDLTLRVDDVLGSPQLEGFSVKVRDLLP